MVLPGESLAKYRRSDSESEPAEDQPGLEENEFEEGTLESSEQESGAEENAIEQAAGEEPAINEVPGDLRSETSPATTSAPETAPDTFEDETVNGWPMPPVDIEEKISRVQPDSPHVHSEPGKAEPGEVAGEQAEHVETAEAEERAEFEPSASEIEGGSGEAAENGEEAEATAYESVGAVSEAAEFSEGGATETQGHEEGGERGESEEIEPARIPQSLTATLREQGGRYMHRVSRRMRRRMRGQGGETQPVRTHERPPERDREQREQHDPREREQKPDTRTVTRPDKLPPQQSISELLKEGQEIVVQIAKEPLGQKGARITSHIALPGRYVVYMPTVEHTGVSRKIASDEERQRLKRILQTHRAGIPGGFIMRTAGEGRTEDEISADMNYLFNLWMDIRQKAEKRPAPCLLHHDLEIVRRVLRDQLTDAFKAIWVDNEDIYESVLAFVQRFQPSLVTRVKMYTRSTPIFDAFNISQELEKALRPKVWLKSGGYIVINQTEALVAIDVNTGKYVGKSNRLEDTIVKTNTEAVKEIVRQMRLRDLGGIIVIDFIDMDERKNRQKVMLALEDAMKSDRAPYKVLQFNDFGLVAITRKRVKQSLERTLCASCPHCEGAGYVKSVQTIIGEILQEANKLREAVKENKEVILRVHPDVAKVFKSKENQYLEELEETLGRPVLVTGDLQLHHEKYDLA